MSAPTNNDGLDDDLALEPTTYARGGVIHGFGDPMTLAMLKESTSARLRRVEQERDEVKQAFAASQADLTRVEQERDELARQVDSLTKSHEWIDSVALNLRESGDLTRAELVTARAELALLRKNEEIRAQVIRERNSELAQLRARPAIRLNGPMVDRLRRCAADTSSNWDGQITIYPPEARELVELIDRAVPKEQTNG